MTYHLFENEMNEISNLNSSALGFFSAGSFFLSLLVTIVTSSIYSGELTETVRALSMFGGVTSGVLAIVCYGVGFMARRQRNAMIDTIKRETATPNRQSAIPGLQ